MADCKQLEEHYESYALGAVDPAERGQLEEHLARGCPTCTAGVAQARALVANLTYLAPDAEPPAALRRKVIDAVRESSAPAQLRPQPRRAWIPTWAWTAAAALVLFAGYTTWQTRRFEREAAVLEGREVREQERSRALESEAARYQQALQIVAAAATKQMQLAPAKAAMPTVTAYWNPTLGLVVSGGMMPEMPAGRTLQLWVVPRQGAPISAGIFRPDTMGQVLLVMPPQSAMLTAKALAISEEPAGGSPQPTSTPEWVGPAG